MKDLLPIVPLLCGFWPGVLSPRNPCPNRNSENSRITDIRVQRNFLFRSIRHFMYCIHVEQRLQVLFDASVLQMFVAFVEGERSAL